MVTVLLVPALWLGCFVSPPLRAQDSENLVTAHERARLHDPRMRAAEANYQAARTKLPQARATLMPTLSAKADRLRNDTEQTTDSPIPGRPSGAARYSSTDYSLNLSQPVYNGAIFAGLKQAEAEVRRAEAEYAAARQELMLRVAEAYFGVLLAQDAHEFAQAEKRVITRQLEVAEARLKVGLATITDVHDARARSETAAAAEIEAANKLEDQREGLREITGAAPTDLARLNENMPLLTPEPPDIEQWVRGALSQNYALLARRAATESAREEIRRLRAGHYPTLDIVGTRSRNDADATINGAGVRTDTNTLGLQLSVPLFQGGLVNARTAEASHRFDAAEQELEAGRRATERAARAAYLGVASGTRKVQALRQAVVAGESALSAKTEGYSAGIHTSLDVLDASRDLYRAKRDLSEARHAYLLNQLRLKQAAGSVSENDLIQINSWLAPANPGTPP